MRECTTLLNRQEPMRKSIIPQKKEVLDTTPVPPERNERDVSLTTVKVLWGLGVGSQGLVATFKLI